MEIKTYIFLTCEGYTYQRVDSEQEISEEIENMQVIGFAMGESAEKAFENLIMENEYLLSAKYKDIFSYSLEHTDYQNHRYLHTINKESL